MNAIARTIRTRIPLISFSTRSLVWFVVIVAMILLIIFLPEITGIRVQRNSVEPDAVSVAREQSPLNEILDQLNEMEQRKPFAPSVREEASEALHEKGISWDVIRSDSVRAALVKAKNQCVQLMESIPADKTFSRYALANYQLALEQLSTGKDDRFSAAGALGYLRHLDEQVTDSFHSDQIDAPLFKRWEEVSLGDVLHTAENRVYREGQATRFDPELTLNRVQLHRVPVGTKVKLSNFTDLSKVMIEGSLLHRGTKKLSLYHGNTFVTNIDIPLPRKRQQDPHVYFTVEAEGYQGVYSFRAESDDGEVYTRSYSFYPKIANISDNPRQNDFQVGTFRQRLLRLDRFFLVGESRPDASPDGMVRF